MMRPLLPPSLGRLAGAALVSVLSAGGSGHAETSNTPPPSSPSEATPKQQRSSNRAQQDPETSAEDAGRATREDDSGTEKDEADSSPNQTEGEPVPGQQDSRLEEEETAKARREEWRKNYPAGGLPKRAEVLSLTVSGGVSLGSYESGLVHLLTEALRRSPGSAKLKVVAGASAGSANAIIAGTEACMTSVLQPEDTLGYKVWVDVGLNDLFDPQRTTERNIFHQDALRRGMGLLEATWKKGLPKSCDFAMGLAATREEGYDVHLARHLEVPRQAEKFTIRLQGRGEHRAPLLENYLDPNRSFERPILPFSTEAAPNPHQDAQAIEQVVLASAAFPVAFDASPVEHCVTSRRRGGRRGASTPPQCDVATRVDRFVDGGVFDNNPLGVAVELTTDGLTKTAAGPQFRPVPSGGPEQRPEVVYGFIDPDIRNYPVYEPPKIERDKQKDPIVGLLARLGGNVLNSARGRELAMLSEQHPDALQRLWLLESSYPPISELLGAFFGFLERDFRDFDFHLGSYETYRDLRDHSGSMLGVEPFLQRMEEIFSGPPKSIPKRYRKLGCILAHAEPDQHGQLAGLCQDRGLDNFRALLQVTIDRLWSNCRKVSDDEVFERKNLQCKRARGGLLPPRVDPDFTVRGQRFRADRESEFDYTMRLLRDYQFEFRDLGLRRDEAKKGRLVVRRRLEEMVDALANAQGGFTNRTVVLTAGRTVLNGIEYDPPKNRWYVTLGSSVATGHLRRLGKQRAFFFSADARIHRLRSLVGGHPEEFTGTLSLGLDWMILPFSGPVLQTSLGVRGGYQFAYNDAAGTQACDSMETRGDSRVCSQPAVHLPLTFTLLERLRLSFTTILYPIGQSWGHNPASLELDVGMELF